VYPIHHHHHHHHHPTQPQLAMCYTSFQKYEGCRFLRQHYIYRDLQCEEMLMWSKFFKREVWCRRTYEHGTQPFADGSRRATPPHYPTPTANINVPHQLVCHRCHLPRAQKRSRASFKRLGEKRTPRKRTVSVRQSLSVQAMRTVALVRTIVPKISAYNLIRMCTKGKWRYW
jgi:hypothetical protein